MQKSMPADIDILIDGFILSRPAQGSKKTDHDFAEVFSFWFRDKITTQKESLI